MSDYLIRKISKADAAAALAIYAKSVVDSHVSFEIEVPTLAEYELRIEKIATKFPGLVAERNGIVVGFAYASTFRDRPAYRWTLETSIYVSETEHGIRPTSVATLLYHALFAELKKRGIKQVIGVISIPNEKSVRFHEKMGFQKIGTFPSIGFKLGKWWDVVFMSKALEDLPFSQPVL